MDMDRELLQALNGLSSAGALAFSVLVIAVAAVAIVFIRALGGPPR